MSMRLQKMLARAGVAGRRKCEEYIAAGRVTLNGATVTEMGVQVDPSIDEVCFDGVPVALDAQGVVIALNKPAGVFTTMHEQRGRTCVADYLPMDEHPSLYHIGRLDSDTTGILLFSTDGDLGNDLLHPSKHVEKEYIAQVKGRPSEKSLQRIRKGLKIEEGERIHQCSPAEAELLDSIPEDIRKQDSCLDFNAPKTSFVRLCIHEGVKHQVKIMLKTIGHPVVHLHRSRFGSVSCDSLKQGEWKYVDINDINR